jgi:choice-of-anchor C domain-containing protein
MAVRSVISIGALALAVISIAPSAGAAVIMNGSFETGTDPGSTTQHNAGSTDISGWTIGGNSVDYIGSGWSASDGARSIDLSGTGAGNIAQTFDTVAGRRYTVTFYLAGNPDAGPLVKTLRTSATGNTSQIDHFDATHSTNGDMGWMPISYDFIAAGAWTTLRFESLNEGSAGPAIDNVSIASVPEVASWTMMLGGFGVLGTALRIRRRVAGEPA